MAFGEGYTARLLDGTPVSFGAPRLSGPLPHRPTDAFQLYPPTDFIYAHEPGPKLVAEMGIPDMAEMGETPKLLAWGIHVDEKFVGVAGLKREDEDLPRAIALVTSPSYTERGIETVGLAVATHHARRAGSAAVRTLVHISDDNGRNRAEALGFLRLGDSRDMGFTTYVLGPASGHHQIVPIAQDIDGSLRTFAAKLEEYQVRALGY